MRPDGVRGVNARLLEPRETIMCDWMCPAASIGSIRRAVDVTSSRQYLQDRGSG